MRRRNSRRQMLERMMVRAVVVVCLDRMVVATGSAGYFTSTGSSGEN